MLFTVTALTSRMFGIWTFMSGLIRMYCALNFKNKQLVLLQYCIELMYV